MIQIYYGFGKGKTTSAVGAGMRAKGAGADVLFVQFLKDNKSSELKVLPFDVYPAPDSLPFNPDESYGEWVKNAMNYVANSTCQVIILDEFLDVVDKFVSLEEAVKLVKELKGEVIITGHREIEELFNFADYITFFEKIKHPYDKGVKARKGIEY